MELVNSGVPVKKLADYTKLEGVCGVRRGEGKK